ncbi:MAG TPA: hypothetical protein VNY07_12015 [Chthoniobacterales bacterium]|nr:hypothetical protein [Chthoniobacterales bacterium]
MEVSDLCWRAKEDLEELFSRAYPTYAEEWEQKFAPHRQTARNATYRVRVSSYGRIGPSISSSLSPGLRERLFSSDDEAVREQASKEYHEIAGRLLKEEPRHAARALAFLIQWGAEYLENLYVRQPVLMKEVAKTRDLWPVNLGLRAKLVKDKRTFEVRRLAFARKYLTTLELNSACVFPSKHESGAQKLSKFKFAAEGLYEHLLLLKSNRMYFRRVTPWAKRLFALSVPMTKHNTAEWWSVAKDYLDERWEKSRKEFDPLIGKLQLSGKTPYESSIKTRIIDNELKQAFEGLAMHNL